MSGTPDVEQSANALVATAVSALNRGELDLAEVHCRQALALEPGHLGALAVLGSALFSLARFREAESLFQELADRSPQTSSSWMNLGTARRASGKLDEALSAYARAAQLGEKSANFFFNLGLTHLERHDYESARNVLTQAMALAPADAEIRLELARACAALGLEDDAIAALLALQGGDALAPQLQARLSRQLLSLGEVSPALHIAARLSSLANLDPQAALTLVQIHERVNRLQQARDLLVRIKSDPRTLSQGVILGDTEARLLQREGRHEEAVDLLRKELAWLRDMQARQTDLFHLANLLAALGRHDECVAAAEEAHRCQLSNLSTSAKSASLQMVRPMLMAQQSADPSDVRGWRDEAAPTSAKSPVFVVGAPRSGKVLVELMLDSHPLAIASEGRPLLPQLIARWRTQGNLYPQSLASLDATQVSAARDQYWREARRKLHFGQNQRLVDTDPMNILQLPAILRLFPNARIVFVARHPHDLLLSLYLQEYSTPDLALMNASLQSLAYCYDKAMRHWLSHCELLRPSVHHVRYEDLVRDFEAEARRLATAVDLSWHDSMSRPEEQARSKNYISSASYAETIEPVSARAVGKWRPYAARFAGLEPLLNPYVALWGYEA
jgi:tetratricopeptide (TPR) repeat protein